MELPHIPLNPSQTECYDECEPSILLFLTNISTLVTFEWMKADLSMLMLHFYDPFVLYPMLTARAVTTREAQHCYLLSVPPRVRFG